MHFLHLDFSFPSIPPDRTIPVLYLPVLPHKAVAEVSEQEPYRRGWRL